MAVKRVLLVIVLAFCCLETFAQVDTAVLLKESDSLYDIGVKLCDAQNYEEAIPFFEKSYKIDSMMYYDIWKKNFLIPGLWRHEEFMSSLLFLFYCRLMQNDTIKLSNKIKNFIRPIDKRVVSDIVSDIDSIIRLKDDKKEHVDSVVLLLCDKVKRMAKQKVGINSYYYVKVLDKLALFYFCNQNDKMLKCRKEINRCFVGKHLNTCSTYKFLLDLNNMISNDLRNMWFYFYESYRSNLYSLYLSCSWNQHQNMALKYLRKEYNFDRRYIRKYQSNMMSSLPVMFQRYCHDFKYAKIIRLFKKNRDYLSYTEFPYVAISYFKRKQYYKSMEYCNLYLQAIRGTTGIGLYSRYAWTRTDKNLCIAYYNNYYCQHDTAMTKLSYNTALIQKSLFVETEKRYEEIIKNNVENKAKQDSLLQKIDSLIWDKEMLVYINEARKFQFLSWNEVRDSLKEKEAAIEFVNFTINGEPDKYAAIILRHDMEAPAFVPLVDESHIAIDESIYADGRMYSYIWQPLEKYFNDIRSIYFAPTGVMNKMNVEVLPDSTGTRANTKWNLHRVSSTRVICMDTPKVSHTGATLYGGLKYDTDTAIMIEQSRGYETDGYFASRGFIADTTIRAGWKYLPATKIEVENISKDMQSHGLKCDVYVGEVGTEESFKALSGKRTPIIHLATHGFFFKDEEVKRKSFFEAMDLGNNMTRPDNSLLRSGLVLSGGQHAWLGEPIPDNVEDGILLAKEIASMDLRGTDLVVLSACETGLGEITNEGVFGLQRAFKKAGVQTLIMSLWKVDDSATALMMQTFYANLLSGKSKRESFLNAQETVRLKYEEPHYWAGFIMLD